VAWYPIHHPRSPQVEINSIFVTLEAGVGHRTAPMLLAKSSFHGDVKNWSTLINLYSQLNLEVNARRTHMRPVWGDTTRVYFMLMAVVMMMMIHPSSKILEMKGPLIRMWL